MYLWIICIININSLIPSSSPNFTIFIKMSCFKNSDGCMRATQYGISFSLNKRNWLILEKIKIPLSFFEKAIYFSDSEIFWDTLLLFSISFLKMRYMPKCKIRIEFNLDSHRYIRVMNKNQFYPEQLTHHSFETSLERERT